ncbi:hypothetical protein ACJ6WF_49520 [Streptomyces sp. MMS24-I2-30]|uniref:hypothetical protein n=1 Tax=Streptomyces sp. MMS24-I2-30 TaxID=3351564 RepID=UPI003896C2D4
MLLRQRREDAARAMEPGDPIRVQPGMVPEDWPCTGVVEEVKEETMIIELDNGNRQEVLLEDVYADN